MFEGDPGLPGFSDMKCSDYTNPDQIFVKSLYVKEINLKIDQTDRWTDE